MFLIDNSGSVGSEHFADELNFVRKLLADFTVDMHTTRVAVISFSSKNKIVRHIDHLLHSDEHHHKCSLLEEELHKVKYTGGGTYTYGALTEAKVSYTQHYTGVRHKTSEHRRSQNFLLGGPQFYANFR